MNLRESILPPGWYPRNPSEISRVLSPFKPDRSNGNSIAASNIVAAGNTLAAVAPHAGWYYSGETAAKAVASLDSPASTIVVIGGHLAADNPPLIALEDAVQTPLGNILIDKTLRDLLKTGLNAREDCYKDNTVEVLLPMLRFFFPETPVVWLRLPADKSSVTAGEIIAQCSQKLGSAVCVLASADLTHYGANYGFSPKGSGEEALKWVAEVNDARFIEAVLSNEPEAMIERANRERSCCSAGAVAAAMGFANAMGTYSARLLEYTSSASKSGECPDSFVGYAAIAMGRDQ